MKALDLFSCIGCHAIGFERAGIETKAFCEINLWRQAELATRFPKAEIYGAIQFCPNIPADIVIGGPPCQETSVASTIHGKRTGASLWPWMLSLGINSGAKWIVVEQPPGNAAWETKVSDDLSEIGFHVARFEFGANDVGAPYIRRRVFMVASASLPRLEIARQSLPRAIDETKRAADARGDWNPDQLASLPMDARSAGEFDRGPASRERREWIEALGDSNPPHMAEAIGRAIVAAQPSERTTTVGGVMETCERCQGNGEIVLDWETYLHPVNLAAEEKSVAECPDCDGEGIHACSEGKQHG